MLLNCLWHWIEIISATQRRCNVRSGPSSVYVATKLWLGSTKMLVVLVTKLSNAPNSFSFTFPMSGDFSFESRFLSTMFWDKKQIADVDTYSLFIDIIFGGFPWAHSSVRPAHLSQFMLSQSSHAQGHCRITQIDRTADRSVLCSRWRVISATLEITMVIILRSPIPCGNIPDHSLKVNWDTLWFIRPRA